MNPFKSFTLKWWQGSLFKLAMLSIGIAIGASWPEVFASWTNVLFVVFLVLSGYLTVIWWKQ